jgi:hypothetical protein
MSIDDELQKTFKMMDADALLRQILKMMDDKLPDVKTINDWHATGVINGPAWEVLYRLTLFQVDADNLGLSPKRKTL